ncbi:MAG TPA: enoyl-CoA hydratase-related protein [Candidatus Dormibacteraeota bacterium]|nr:enoyl-CoA hydratase-related protein [Candidatus Dormibacteraeota bacterium]
MSAIEGHVQGKVEPVLTSRAHGVLTLTLNRPERLNALTPELLDALTSLLRAADTDDSVRAIVITGAGRGFCSGHDLKAAAESGDRDVRRALHEHYAPVIHSMRDTDKPIVAAVNGAAAGAGFSIVLAADLRLAAESASFAQAFVRIGLVPDTGSTYLLPALIGHARAAELMMLGEPVGAARALELGIVNRVVPDDRVLAEATAIAERLAAGPMAVSLIKQLLRRTQEAGSDLASQMHAEEEAQGGAAASADFLEGIAAFTEKRPPRFTGR